MLEMTPLRSALTSRSIFSVSSSTTGSPTSTRSPSFFSQRATRASTTDSPSSGTTMLVIRLALGGSEAAANQLRQHHRAVGGRPVEVEGLFDHPLLIELM